MFDVNVLMVIGIFVGLEKVMVSFLVCGILFLGRERLVMLMVRKLLLMILIVVGGLEIGVFFLLRI